VKIRNWFSSALLLSVGAVAAAEPPTSDSQKETATAPTLQRTDLFSPPMVKLDCEVKLGPIERYQLPNGLEVIVVPRPSVPVVDITLAVAAGGNDDPVEQGGLSQFVASMLRKGTEKRTADQIADEIDFAGGSLGANADDDATLVSCRARAKDLALCLDLLADTTLHPTFPIAEMNEVHDEMMAEVVSMRDSPQRLAAAHVANLFFGDRDPRGRLTSEASLAKIDRASLVSFYQRWYAPQNATLAIAGDVDPKALKKRLAAYFGGWRRRPLPKRPPRDLPKRAAMQLRLVDKPDATQSAIVAVGPGLRHASSDYFAVRLMNYALGGGGFSSRLMKSVRSEGGKTYGAHSQFSAGRDAGTFTISTFTRTPETVHTLKLVLDEVSKMQSSGPTEEELQSAKGHLIGGFGLRLETGTDLARALVESKIDGLDADFVKRYPVRLKSVTLAEAAKAATRYLEPSALVVVGPAQEVKPLLEAAGYQIDEVVHYLEPVSREERAHTAAR
jgi:zinc protease